MHRRFVLLFFAAAAPPCVVLGVSASGCGSNVTQTPSDEDGGMGGGGGGQSDGSTSTTNPSSTSGGKDAFPDYTDPGCPDAGPPNVSYDCDPYNQGNGDCAFEEGCYIFVQYPSEPCGQETYGSVCAPSGIGEQGDGCFGALDCAAGYVCVISGSGNQCIQLCSLVGDDGCPAGLVCEPIDVEGFGGCL